ncbi:MAG: prepilin peptidase [Candidatus Marinamargulisbacteria bacterium]
MGTIQIGLICYFIFIHVYFINTLITELPLDDRYVRLKKHFTLKRFLSIFYYPFQVWFKQSFRDRPFIQKCRHFTVLCLTVVMYILFFKKITTLNVFLHFVVFSVLIIILFTDMEHQIIPNELSFGLFFLGILYSFFNNTFLNGVKGFVLVLLVFLVIGIVAQLFGQAQPFGAGDIKLSFAIGMFWGWKVTSIMLYFSFVIGGVVGVYLMLIKRRNKNSYIAFAPAIILGLIFALIYTDDIFKYYFPNMSDAYKVQIQQVPNLKKLKKPLPKP